RAHAAQAAVMPMLRWTGRVVRGEVVKGDRHASGIQIVPEGNTLPAEYRPRRLVVEGPEVERQSMFADLPRPLAGQRPGGGEERLALFVRMAVDEVEDAVRARPGAVDEVGPGDGTLRGDARAQGAESAAFAQPRKVRQLSFFHHGGAQHGVHAVD